MRQNDDVKVDIHMKPSDVKGRLSNKPYFWVICVYSEDEMKWEDSSYYGWEKTVEKAWETAKETYETKQLEGEIK